MQQLHPEPWLHSLYSQVQLRHVYPCLRYYFTGWQSTCLGVWGFFLTEEAIHEHKNLRNRKQWLELQLKQVEREAWYCSSVSVTRVCSSVEPEVPVLLSLWFWFSQPFLGLSGFAWLPKTKPWLFSFEFVAKWGQVIGSVTKCPLQHLPNFLFRLALIKTFNIYITFICNSLIIILSSEIKLALFPTNPLFSF